jgi:V/A-type H+-transporting ATPase subunit C
MAGISIPRLESRALKYGYSNARVSGMKGLLLKASEIDELLKVKSIEAVIELLQRTHYKEDLVSLSLLYRGSTLIELAAGKHFARVAKKIVKITPKSDRKSVEAMLKRWDLLNLKTIVTAKRLGKKYEEIKAYLVPVGTLGENDFERLAKADERAIFDEIQRTDFGKEMLSQSTAFLTAEMMKTFKDALRNMDSFMQLQTLLDAYMYVYIDRNLANGSKDIENIKKIFRREIDAKNVSMIERMKARGFEKDKIKKYVVKGGTLSDFDISTFIDAKDISSVITIAKTKIPGISSEEIKDIVGLEIALEKAIAHEKLHAFYLSTLSVGTLLGFLLLKEEELHNLRKIAKSKEYNLAPEKIREMLVTV